MSTRTLFCRSALATSLALLLAVPLQAAPQRYDSHTLDPSSSASTAADLLLAIPGFFQMLTATGTEQIGLGGLSSSYLQILVNGSPIPAPDGQSRAWLQRISASRVRAIEVDREGNARQEWGGGAATINLIISEQEGSSHFSIHGGDADAGHGLSIDTHSRHDWQAGFSEQAATRQDERNSRQSHKNADLDWHTAPTPNIRLSSAIHDWRSEQSRKDSFLSPDLQLEALDAGARANELWMNLQSWSNQMTVNIDQQRLTLNTELATHERDQIWDNGYFHQAIQRYQLGLMLEELQDEHRWAFGANYRYQRLRETVSQQADSGSMAIRTRENHYQAFAEDNWQLTADARLHTGVRLESYDINQYEAPNVASERIASATWWLPSVTLYQRLGEHHNLIMSASQSVRPLDPVNLIPYSIGLDNHTWHGNRDAMDEIINRHEMEWQYQPGTSGQGQTLVHVRLLQHIRQNSVAWQIDSIDPTQVYLNNTGRSGRTQGIESGIRDWNWDSANLMLGSDIGFYRMSGDSGEPVVRLRVQIDRPENDQGRLYGLRFNLVSASHSTAIGSDGEVTINRAAGFDSCLYVRQHFSGNWYLSTMGRLNRFGASNSETGAMQAADSITSWQVGISWLL
ncbi:TonB-dependent receptor plug domain-containing protein [Parathalassolituus penaei]|uniref:TonB-dependent receptor n=1 Tax=Parathalassolituus penaei TaxID=2997323 RepID=A0A9X3EBF8_9GAMM|nr:TonB-dependent receptor [Parathalassolituus penaei]MCY0964452.1 TonB-dependent receptor [Parathalassolituus penaei]